MSGTSNKLNGIPWHSGFPSTLMKFNHSNLSLVHYEAMSTVRSPALNIILLHIFNKNKLSF